MSGTSMACPGAAATGALIRQYFEEGWFPTGSKVPEDQTNPSGALIKAVLINGAMPLIGVDNTPIGEGITTLPSSPDNHQGFGRINLLNSLPLSGKNEILSFIQDGQSLSSGGQNTYDFTVKTTGSCTDPFSVTLTWTDPPGSSGCSRYVV